MPDNQVHSMPTSPAKGFRLGVVSDIHGNLAALEAVVAHMKQQGVDQVVNLGDSLSGPLLPLETARYLMAQDWVHLAGNHERQVLQLAANAGSSDRHTRAQLSAAELAWIASLPHSCKLNRDVLLCHGTPDSDCTGLLQTAERNASHAEIVTRLGDTRASLILCGHTHIPRVARVDDTCLIVNPGSVGRPAYTDTHPYPHVVENGSPEARYAIVQHDGQAWQVALYSVAYDHHAMAALAKLRQRPEWEYALLTGYMPTRANPT